LAENTAPGAEIKCDGKPLPQQIAGQVTEVMVESRLDLPGNFAVTLNDGSLASIDSREGLLREGGRLEISLGFDKKYRSLITGEISAVSAEMSAQGIFARVTGFDLLHRLSRGTNYRRYESGGGDGLTDSMIARNLLNDAGLKPAVDDTTDRSVPRIQDNRSDLDFLVILANLNGFYLYCEDDRAFFSASPPDRGEVALTWGKNLRTFYPGLNLNGLVNTLEVRGWDLSLDESFVETVERSREDLLFLSSAGRDMMGRGSGGGSVLNLHDALITSGSDAKRFLSSVMRQKQGLVFATGSCIGNSELRAGTKLQVQGAGRFSGNYVVTRAVHNFSSRGYTTVFNARMVL